MLFYWYFKGVAVFKAEQTADLQSKIFGKIYDLGAYE